MTDYSKLSLKKLYSLKKNIEDIIAKKENIKTIKMIRKEVKEKGWYATNEFDEDINGLAKYHLPYNVRVTTMDKEDFQRRDCHVSLGYRLEQEPWVSALKIDENTLKINDHCNYELLDEWEFGDRDDPATTIGVIWVSVYFERKSCPPEGSKFTLIYCEEEISQCEVKKDGIYEGSTRLFPLKDWEQYGGFII